MAVTLHGVLPRDSHEISPTIGGVHKLMILLRDLAKETLQNIFGEEMGGVTGNQTPLMGLLAWTEGSIHPELTRCVMPL